MNYAETRCQSRIDCRELYDDLHTIKSPDALKHIIIDKIMFDVFDIGKTVVSWSIKDTAIDPSLFSFFVEQSGSPEGAYTRLNKIGLTNEYTYVDTESPTFGKFRRVYYRIGTQKNSTHEIYYTKAKGFYDEPDLVGLEIARRNRLLLHKVVGVPCVVHKRKHWGERCDNCWDDKLKRSTKAKCSVCYDTGYKDGYWSPIPAMINLNPSPSIVQQTPWGKMEPSSNTAWMSNWPLVEPQDVITELLSNKRWVVKNVVNTEKRRVPLKQIFQIEELDKGRVEFSLSVGYDGRFWFTQNSKSTGNATHTFVWDETLLVWKYPA